METMRPKNDDYGTDRRGPDWARLRREMVQTQLARRDISDPGVLRAMESVPRERFVPPELHSEAYGDHPLAIGHGQTISQPYIVALMTQALRPGPGAKILEIGTGSGYQTAVLAEMGAEVYTVERYKALSDKARQALADLGYADVRFLVGDGTLGWPEFAPYDGILVTAGAPSAPEPLKRQLAEGGRLVVPVGDESYQELLTIERSGQEWATRSVCPCRFVKLIGKEGWREGSAP